jgi:DUF4097 and DUF4098 domain-containing protein YvlB
MKSLALITLSLSCVLATPAWADSCRHEADRSVNIAGPGIKKVVIRVGAGDLDIRGESGQDSVAARGKACASNEQLLSGIQIASRREGDTVYLEAVMPQDDDDFLSFHRYATLDLRVTVPESVALSVDDSSGDAQLRNVRATDIADSSGDLRLYDIQGDLEVEDSSGGIDIRNVSGHVRVEDSSGDIDIQDVRGDVLIGDDSSGGLRIEDVAGGVRVVQDSSGDIRISDVQRDVRIDADSSGGIHVARVGGSFTVGADSSGTVDYEQVAGSVRIADRE